MEGYMKKELVHESPSIYTGYTRTIGEDRTVFVGSTDNHDWVLKFENKGIETRVKLSYEAMEAVVDLYNNLEGKNEVVDTIDILASLLKEHIKNAD